ncbi:UdgX family uracil-DNA binding protein [Sulfitobacter sp. KE29]|uniref:UdgX family uracil-DNA binding protein n=1 Tax=Sulfitobacter TaxID=60136 RepID=UPI0007C35E69|nr:MULTISPECIES: UdgX family uracil-DNA binding protein [Sulfitobacter]KZY54075.1 uracil-DNA glycosylase [Sulfitobacter sp. HI0054]MBO9439482.1 UdgX family uracil-DNA binding protein [Sulfitobacter sp. R18_2]MDF3416942.1 UdgX family uracil-DNA binding protein [Sulfitobacter sp. Ks38]MDF3424424.1 UdgX family uracil-DNA binding protein [Sulfitobacter sp. KE29]MDF3428004.1 UdgX family uracil-DNA binding protein [Sulfitobacter sp. S46]
MHRVSLPPIGTAKAWREAARGFLAAGVPPEQILWGDHAAAPDLFGAEAAPAASGRTAVPRSFVSMAETAVWHSDPERFARLYAFLWRLKDAPHLMSDRGDADLAVLRGMEKNVRRCQHKMKAFVRFREIGDPNAPRRSFAAWFEPTHHTVEPTADFFVRRFSDMDWRILTPDVSAIFEGGKLSFQEGHTKPDLPEDAGEQLWITYFQNIFNPARLMVKAMQSEMPKKYWKNMPEAAFIPQMIAEAPARARAMAEAAPTLPPARMDRVQAQLSAFDSAWDGPAEELPSAIRACTRCPLHCHATQAVPGEGPRDADLMVVGEQPGDQEDLAGRPFVGPAGQMFDRIAGEAGLDRDAAFVTNAVKHFKFTARGKRRIHQRPETPEIDQCRWWMNAEVAQVQPKLILAMGATAAQSLTGKGAGILKRRGTIEAGPEGIPVLITLHPSYLLRVPDPAAREEAEAQFRSDLAMAARMMAEAA